MWGSKAWRCPRRAYQQAVAYARDRVQGKPIGGAERDPIIQHPDVRRMLMDMRSRTEAMRALAYCTAACMDRARHHPDPGGAGAQPGPGRAAHPGGEGLVH